MKRFKMGVLNNLQTHKIYATNRKIIYQGPKINTTPNQEKKSPKPKEKIIKPPPNPFANLPKIDPFSHLRK